MPDQEPIVPVPTEAVTNEADVQIAQIQADAQVAQVAIMEASQTERSQIMADMEAQQASMRESQGEIIARLNALESRMETWETEHERTTETVPAVPAVEEIPVSSKKSESQTQEKQQTKRPSDGRVVPVFARPRKPTSK